MVRDRRHCLTPSMSPPPRPSHPAASGSPAVPESTVARCLEFPSRDDLRFLPEGPYPLPPSSGGDGFSWVAIQHGGDSTVGSLNRYYFDDDRHESFDLPGRPGFAFPTDREGVYVVGCERSIGLFDCGDRSWRVLADGVDADVDNTIINDGVIAGGDLIFGCKELEFKTPKAGLYLFRGGTGELVRLRDDQICSNGKAVLSDDGDVVEFLDIDSPSRKIVRYRLHRRSAELSESETVVDFDGDAAVPDGQTLTPDGKHLIVAMFRPEAASHGETRMYSVASGRLVRTWTTEGSPQNTCPVLVPRGDRSELIITTAVENLSADDQQRCPHAGRLFAAETAFPSAPTVTFPIG